MSVDDIRPEDIGGSSYMDSAGTTSAVVDVMNQVRGVRALHNASYIFIIIGFIVGIILIAKNENKSKGRTILGICFIIVPIIINIATKLIEMKIVLSI